MALPEFSTLESTQLRANAKRIKGWTDKDKDTTPDTDTLTAGFQYASGVIFEYLTRRFGETQLASWTLANCPPRLLSISDDLCLYYFSSMNNSQNTLIKDLYDNAIASLNAIGSGAVMLYGATEDVTDKFVVDDADSGYEEERYWNCLYGHHETPTCCD
jgi:phage gp36-like protein